MVQGKEGRGGERKGDLGEEDIKEALEGPEGQGVEPLGGKARKGVGPVDLGGVGCPGCETQGREGARMEEK